MMILCPISMNQAFHTFVMLNGLADTAAARSTISLAIQNLRESLRTIDD